MDNMIGFYKSCGYRGVLYVCLGCVGLGGEWVGPGSGGVEWCYVCVSCESTFFV